MHVWHVQEKEEKKPGIKAQKKEEAFWNSFNLLASEKEDGLSKARQIHGRQLCDIAADGDLRLADDLYYFYDESEVWAKLARLKARNTRF